MQVVRSLAWFGLVATVLAAEKPSTESPAPPREDSIAAAKRDLEVIKAARSGTEQPRADLPTLATPEMHLGLVTPQRTSLRKPSGEAAASKKSSNWLVDAMAKTPEPAADGKALRRDDKLNESGTENDREEGGRNRVEAGGKVDRREPRAGAESVVNPLTNFMAGWMTPQDFKLLQPGMGNESAANLVARGESSSGPTALVNSAELSGLSFSGRKPPIGLPVPPRENPFLREFSAPALPGVSAVAIAVLPPAAVPVPAPKGIAPALEPPPQKTGTPAFAKPNDDTKYFKPLKRF